MKLQDDKEKTDYLSRVISICSALAAIIAIFVITSCEKELNIQTDFPFEMEVMPVPKSIAVGEKVQIRCQIKAAQKYAGTKYYIRYFQQDGQGKLIMENGTMLKPNDSYPLLDADKQFTIYYVSASTVSQAFDIWIYDNHGNEQKMSFQFNNKS